MTLGTGTVSIRRIQVLDNPTRTNFKWILDKLSSQLIMPIGIDEVREESIGWCHPFTGEPNLESNTELCFENAFVFGLRCDSKKVPGTLFRLQMKAALESLSRKGSDDAQQRRIPKKLKDAARDRIRHELLKHTLPNIRLAEVVWHLDSNEVWLASTSKSTLQIFEKLFTETFAVAITHVNPGTMSIDFSRALSDSKYSFEKLFDLTPVDLLVGARTAAASASASASDSGGAAPF
jgi:hypothetical protein